MICAEVRDAAAEFALDILDPVERSAIAAHLIRCPDCRAEVDSMAAVGARLIELVPGTEPPLGFDRRVLARVNPAASADRGVIRGRPRLFAAVTAAAAAVALVFGSLGWFAGRTTSHTPHVVLTAEFHQSGQNVGEVYAYSGRSPWLSMTVHGLAGSTVTCELVGNHGTVIIRLGSFPLAGGSGTWGAPDPAGFTGVTGARLVSSTGQTLATATFR
jgi:anti-sigma-K factor RskA